MKYYVNVNKIIEIEVDDKDFEEMVNKQKHCEAYTNTEFKIISNKLEKIVGVPVYDGTNNQKDYIWSVRNEDDEPLLEI